MNYSVIQHRFANKLEGKYGCIKSGNVRYEGNNFYSYSTVFGQWVDTNVCIIYEGGTSSSSSKHQLGESFFPSGVHLFPYDDGGSGYYCSWHGCDLMGWGREFDINKRFQLMDYYISVLYGKFEAITRSKSKGTEKVSFVYWDYMEKLCSLYKDTTIPKYIKHAKKHFGNKKVCKGVVKLVGLLRDGERDVKTITNALFGEGTFERYWNYCARFRKQEERRLKMCCLCSRLGISNPYEGYQYGVLQHDMKADEIRKLSAGERNKLHFMALEKVAFDKNESERKKKYEKNNENAYKWIVGFEPTKSTWSGCSDKVSRCTNMFTGKTYDTEFKGYSHPYFTDFKVSFNYNNFRSCDDKKKWISDFYAKCELVDKNIRALSILESVGAHKEQRGRYSWDKAYINDDYLRSQIDDEESMELVADFIERQDRYYEEEAARMRAEEIARKQREEERRKEEEYRAKVKQEQIEECMSNGVEGHRDLWRLHLDTITNAESGVDENDFYQGGNVLLRFNLSHDKIETSKQIRLDVDTCKKMWKIINHWHERAESFRPCKINTHYSGTYQISSYENDILTAGCHKIAYAEMERMYNEIINA